MTFKIKIFLFYLICQSLQGQQTFDIFFESDAYTLVKSEQLKLEKWLNDNNESKVLSINGFTDQDGTEGYNDTLSAKRVQFVYEKIKNKIKIRDDFKKLHFGKLHLQRKNKAENRRVTLFFLSKNELSQEATLIPEAKEIEVIPTKPTIEYPNFIVITNPDGSKS